MRARYLRTTYLILRMKYRSSYLRMVCKPSRAVRAIFTPLVSHNMIIEGLSVAGEGDFQNGSVHRAATVWNPWRGSERRKEPRTIAGTHWRAVAHATYCRLSVYTTVWHGAGLHRVRKAASGAPPPFRHCHQRNITEQRAPCGRPCQARTGHFPIST